MLLVLADQFRESPAAPAVGPEQGDPVSDQQVGRDRWSGSGCRSGRWHIEIFSPPWLALAELPVRVDDDHVLTVAGGGFAFVDDVLIRGLFPSAGAFSCNAIFDLLQPRPRRRTPRAM
jgi:hypothetical protein